jgi:hypothetical protein
LHSSVLTLEQALMVNVDFELLLINPAGMLHEALFFLGRV